MIEKLLLSISDHSQTSHNKVSHKKQHNMKTLIILCLLITASASKAQTYEYDAAGRLIIARYANGLETRYTYDKNGNIVKSATDVISSVDGNDTKPQTLKVSPQPSANEITLEGLDDAPVVVTLSATNGEEVLRQTATAMAGKAVINIQHLVPGVYAAIAVQGARVYTSKVLLY